LWVFLWIEKKRIRPFALLLRHGSTGSSQGIFQHRPPSRRVEQSNANRTFDEGGYA